jgi:hypothetical protein
MEGILNFINSFSCDILKITEGDERVDILNRRIQTVALRAIALATMFLGVMTGFAAMGSFLSLSIQFIPLSIYTTACVIISHDSLKVGNNLSKELKHDLEKIICIGGVCRRVLRSVEKVKESYSHVPSCFKGTWLLEPGFKIISELSED